LAVQSELIFQPIRKPGFLSSVFATDDRMATQQASPKIRVLIVEDDYLAASEAEAVLNEAGVDVIGIASSADEAIRMAKAERPNLALMDIRLTGARDGVDAAIELFREYGVRSVFATAHHDAFIRSRAQPAAPLGWLAKPYTTNALISVVKSAAAELNKKSG
jgi:DNA-binding NarL/FixJ family response regulator